MLFETQGVPGVDRPPVTLAYGMGVNGTAMALGLYERGLMPDAVLSADTGGEKPLTYQYLFRFDRFLADLGFPRHPNTWIRPPGYEDPDFGLPERHDLLVIQIVRNTGAYVTLENNCLQKGMVPSLAYGRRSCSDKYKIRPQHNWCVLWEPARKWWRLGAGNKRPREVTSGKVEGRRVVRLIGFDAGEDHRSDTKLDEFYRYLYPLRTWNWNRERCEQAIKRFGLDIPPKSACFFCPASKKHEIIQLGLMHPPLLQRALDMETNAAENGGTEFIKGLGKWYSWADVVAGARTPEHDMHGCVCSGQLNTEDEDDDVKEEIDDEDFDPAEAPA